MSIAEADFRLEETLRPIRNWADSGGGGLLLTLALEAWITISWGCTSHSSTCLCPGLLPWRHFHPQGCSLSSSQPSPEDMSPPTTFTSNLSGLLTLDYFATLTA